MFYNFFICNSYLFIFICTLFRNLWLQVLYHDIILQPFKSTERPSCQQDFFLIKHSFTIWFPLRQILVQCKKVSVLAEIQLFSSVLWFSPSSQNWSWYKWKNPYWPPHNTITPLLFFKRDNHHSTCRCQHLKRNFNERLSKTEIGLSSNLLFSQGRQLPGFFYIFCCCYTHFITCRYVCF